MVSLLSFFFIHMIPGDPSMALLGPNATPNEIGNLKLEMGLDKPLPLQYATWLGKMLTGDMGNSILSGRPIFKSIAQRLPHTMVLAFLSILFSISIAIPIGIIAAVKQNTIIDRVVMFLALVGVSVPSFWLGILGIILFAVTLQWIPAAGYVSVFENTLIGLKYMALPSISLGLVLAAVSTRMTRASMLETLRQDYIRTARAKGLGKWAAILKHGVKNALIPVITVIGVDFGWLLGGTVVIETVFGIPGMGRFMVYGIMNRDYPVIQGVILYMAIIYMLVNLIVDIMVIFLNPRIKT